MVAEHAAHCLLASRDEMSCGKNAYRWEGFCVGTFLFRELSEGGTVGIFGSVEKFLDQLVETLERFAAAGLISEGDGCRWVAEMRAARCDFLRYYDAATSEDEAIAIARRHLPRARRRI